MALDTFQTGNLEHLYYSLGNVSRIKEAECVRIHMTKAAHAAHYPHTNSLSILLFIGKRALTLGPTDLTQLNQ